MDMIISTTLPKIIQTFFQLEKILCILSAWSNTDADDLCNILRILYPKILRIIGQSNIDQASERCLGFLSGMKGFIMDTVAPNFANIEVLLDLFDL